MSNELVIGFLDEKNKMERERLENEMAEKFQI